MLHVVPRHLLVFAGRQVRHNEVVRQVTLLQVLSVQHCKECLALRRFVQDATLKNLGRKVRFDRGDNSLISTYSWIRTMCSSSSGDENKEQGPASDKKDSVTRKSEPYIHVPEYRPKPVKPRRVYHANTRITPEEAQSEYLLSESDLAGLQVYIESSPYSTNPTGHLHMYRKLDVEERAIEKHGSLENIKKEKEKNLKRSRSILYVLRSKFSSSSKSSRLQAQDVELSVEWWKTGPAAVVGFAIFVNVLNAGFKGICWYYSGSSAMFSEFIHSLADTGNQMFLFWGIVQSSRKPDTLHPYGYSNMRHITALISGVLIFVLGSVSTVYHGMYTLFYPEALHGLHYNIGVLCGSFLSEGASLLVAIREMRRKSEERGISFWQYVQQVVDPNVNVVFLEDLVAVTGVVVAGGCMYWSHLSGSPIPDALGCITVGLMLGGVAYFVTKTSKDTLLGKSVGLQREHQMRMALEADRMVRFVHDVKTTVQGVDYVRFKGEVEYDGREITRAFLEQCDMDQLIKDMSALQTKEEYEEFLVNFGGIMIDRLGQENDRIEKELKTLFPELRHIDLEVN